MAYLLDMVHSHTPNNVLYGKVKDLILFGHCIVLGNNVK